MKSDNTGEKINANVTAEDSSKEDKFRPCPGFITPKIPGTVHEINIPEEFLFPGIDGETEKNGDNHPAV